MQVRSNVELNCKTSITELRGLLSGRTDQFGQFLVLKSKEWNLTISELLGAFEKLNAEFSTGGTANKNVFRAARRYLSSPSAKASLTNLKTPTLDENNKLASIIEKYINLDTVGELTANNFVYELFSRMDEDEIIYVSGLYIDDITKIEPYQVIKLCAEGMIKNNLLAILETYRLGLDR